MGNPIVERYDRNAAGYEECWGPVLHPGGTLLRDRLETVRPDLQAGASLDVLEVGCGTGRLLAESALRWPGARLTALDASGGMLAAAERLCSGLPRGASRRVTLVQADAATMPFADGAFDVAMSAFVVQLVPDRPAVLAEMRRILRPGATLALGGWLEERSAVPFEPEVAFEACLADLGIVRPARHETRAGDFRSVDGAAAELAQAGFRVVTAGAVALDHAWAPETYARYKRVSREADLYRSLEPEPARRLADTFRARLERLYENDPGAFHFRPPVVLLIATPS